LSQTGCFAAEAREFRIVESKLVGRSLDGGDARSPEDIDAAGIAGAGEDTVFTGGTNVGLRCCGQRYEV
jgi:hypothetical protein